MKRIENNILPIAKKYNNNQPLYRKDRDSSGNLHNYSPLASVIDKMLLNFTIATLLRSIIGRLGILGTLYT